MTENQEIPPLKKPTKHPQEVEGYIKKGAPEELARIVVAKDISSKRKDRKVQELTEQSMMDVLTGLPNRRYLFTELAKEFSLAKRNGGYELSVLFLDGDHFKAINDELGHKAGDSTLKQFADVFKRSLRASDTIGRVGGEEFVALLPRTNSEHAQQAAEKLLEVVRAHPSFPKSGTTISIGVSTFDKDLDRDPEDLLGRADDAVYHAKEMGRNRAEVWTPQTPQKAERQFSKVDVSPKS